ncbi:MAG: TonB family protein [Povalibacter sp.]
MYAERRSSSLSRPGPLIAVVVVHAMIAYLLSVSMGVVPIPKVLEAAQVVFIPEQEKVIPEPEIQPVKPDIAQQEVVDTPMPQVEIPPEIESPVTDAPASDTAPVASPPVAAAAQNLKVTTRTEPIYPPASRRAGEEGTVRLRILVDERGMPREVQVTQGSGFARLDQAAMDAVRKWKFAAASNGSQPVTSWTNVAVTFRLQNS